MSPVKDKKKKHFEACKCFKDSSGPVLLITGILLISVPVLSFCNEIYDNQNVANDGRILSVTAVEKHLIL